MEGDHQRLRKPLNIGLIVWIGQGNHVEGTSTFASALVVHVESARIRLKILGGRKGGKLN